MALKKNLILVSWSGWGENRFTFKIKSGQIFYVRQHFINKVMKMKNILIAHNCCRYSL